MPGFRFLFERRRYWAGRLRGEFWRFIVRACGGRCGRGFWLGRGVVWKYAPHAGLMIGDNVQLGEYCIVDVPLGGELILGDHVKLSMGCVIAAQQRVEIGRDSLVGEYCSLRDGDHSMAVESAIRLQPIKTTPVSIGCDVWLGRGVAVLRGAVIHDSVIVGANAVVLAGVLPARAVCVGSPCRVVKYR